MHKILFGVLLSIGVAFPQSKMVDGLHIVGKTVATLPAASANTNKIFRVTDGTSDSDCTAGGSNHTSFCVSNGTTWVSVRGAIVQTELPATSVDTTSAQTLSSKTVTAPSLGAGSSPVTETWTVGAGGVTANTLVQMDSSAPAKIVASTTGAYGIALSTVSAAGTVEVARFGTVNCVTDTGGSVAGHLVIVGTGNAINCKDSGLTSSSSIPISTRIIGVFRSTATAGNVALVELTPAHFGTQIGALTTSALEYYIDPTCAAAGNPQCYATPAAALAVANVNEGHVYNNVAGTYTLSVTMSVGAPTKQVWFTNGPGVVYNCTMTDGSNCIQIYDGSGFEGPMGYVFAANGANTKVTLSSSAHVSNVITNAEQDGSAQSAYVAGIFIVGNFSGAVIDQAAFHIRGMFSSTKWEGLNTANLPNTIGLLIDTPSNATVTATAATASGSTVTLTVPASTDASPDGHHTWIGGTIVVSGCSDAGYNGTVTVTATPDNTHVKYTGTAPGSSTSGCHYVPTNAAAITSVIDIKNVVINMNNNNTTHTGGHPILISDRGSLGNITCENQCNAEGGTPGGAAIDIEGNGITATNNTLNTIALDSVHCEPASPDTSGPTCVKIVDANNVIIKSINGSACSSGPCVGSNLVTVDQSGSNITHNIVIIGATKKDWNNIVTNNIDSAFTTPSSATDLGIQVFPGLSTSVGIFGAPTRPVRTVTFSATPVFNMNADQLITLTGNVTSSTISNALAGSTVNFTICQDGTGSRTFVWPTVLHGATTIGSTASKCTSQAFQSPDGTTFYALAAGVTNQ